MAKYQVETEKGSFTLNGSTAAALASALLVKLNNQRANGYKINGSYGDNMFSVILVDKDRKPFKEYYLKKVGKTQDGSMPPAFRIEFYSPRLGNRQSAYVMAKTKNEAINKFFKEKPQYKGKIEIKSVTMLNARELPKQKALKVGDSKKTQDKSPLSFMDSVVRAFRDSEKPFRIVATYRTSGKKRSFLVLANSFNEAKNKVKRHYEKSGLMEILSDVEKFEGYEIRSIPTEKFKKHYGNKEVIVN